MYDMAEEFFGITDLLLEEKKAYGELIKFNVVEKDSINIKNMNKRFDKAFEGKYAYKGGKKLKWREWLLNGVFPQMLYKKNNSSLIKLLGDGRLYDNPTFFGRESYHSFVGRMSRRRNEISDEGFMDYLLARWSSKNKNHRSMPHFYFSVEDPEWVFEELMRNPNQIKSGRTAVSCVMNISLRWDSKGEFPILTFMLKHSQWSHLYGDFLGATAFLRAVCKELNLPYKGGVHIFCISITLDDSKKAREIVQKGCLYDK